MPSARSTSSKPVRILLVDYNRHGFSARRTLLQEEGYEVECRRSIETTEPVEGTAPRLIVLANDSYEAGDLVAALRAKGLDAPVILLSSIAETAGLTPASTGAKAVIQKSAQEITELKRVISRLLDQQRRPAKAVSPTKSASKRRA